MLNAITNNEQQVRFRIYEGDLKIDDAAAELISMYKAQAEAAQAWARELWQPIETAPKDGTLFIARDSDGWVFLCGWWPIISTDLA